MRAVAIYALLSLQVQLLWVTALHRHGSEGTPGPRPASVERRNPATSPGTGSEVVCLACQIIRHSAARPAVGTPARVPQVRDFVPTPIAPSDPHGVHPTAVYGRAPPCLA